MRTPAFALTIVAALCFVTALSSAQKQNSGKTETSSGVQVTTFETHPGKIKVSLPDDMAAGDTVSGTVIAEPSGKTDKEKQQNAGELNGYVVEIENQKSPVSGGVLQRIHLAPGTPAPLLILLDAKGKQVGVVPLVVQPSAPAAPSAFKLPTLGQAGTPTQIQGPFDGDSANTSTKVGGTDAKVIAESPRKLVVESPREVVGPTRIEVAENGAATKGDFRNLKIDLTAPKTSLLKGESTELHVEVNGLEGLTQPIPIQIQNQSPSTVKLGGGDTQNIVIQPGQVQSGGSFPWNGNLTGTGNGPFIIIAKLPPGFNIAAIPSTSPSPSIPTQPTQTTATASPSPSPAAAQSSVPKVLPAPAPTPNLYSGLTEETHNCCKKYLDKNGVLSFRDEHGNGFQLDKNALTMVVDGQRYEWLFTQDGQPFPIAWMFCHLNKHQIISQLTHVMVQRVAGGNVNERSSTISVSLHGPYHDEKSRWPSYGFLFEAQKVGTEVQEYSVSFSMDEKTCTWGCQLIAQGKVREFRTEPRRSPKEIFDALGENEDLPTGERAYLQQNWWNIMYRYLSEIDDWKLWLSDIEGLAHDREVTGQAYDLWRSRLQQALEQMQQSAATADQRLIGQMLELLKISNPTVAQLNQVYMKFDELHLVYGTKVPPDIRKQLLNRH